MSLFGLSMTTWLAGLGALAAVLGLLHLLRIRLRQVEVETLLFFRMAGPLHKPRTLGGKPQRWLSYLLSLLLLVCLWTSFGDPVQDDNSPSRVVLLDQSGTGLVAMANEQESLWHGRLAKAQELAAALGPRGAVLAYGNSVSTLLQSGEPTEVLAWRAKDLQAQGMGSSFPAAMQQARSLLTAGDEILVLGGPEFMPEEIDGIKVQRIAQPAVEHARVVNLRLQEWPWRSLSVEVHGEAAKVSLAGEVVAKLEKPVEAKLRDGLASMSLYRLPAEACTVQLALHGADGILETLPLNLPAREPVPLLRPDSLPMAVQTALDGDPAFEKAEANKNRLQLAWDKPLDPSLPALLLQEGVDPQPRQALRTQHCPLSLSLQDMRRAAAPALLPIAGETVWVEDSLSGAPLVALQQENVDGQAVARLRVVTWLLDEAAHRDVPRLLLGGLHHLAALPLQAELDVNLPVPPAPATQPAQLASLAGAGHWWPALLLLALLFFGLDLWLYHRGRLP